MEIRVQISAQRMDLPFGARRHPSHAAILARDPPYIEEIGYQNLSILQERVVVTIQ